MVKPKKPTNPYDDPYFDPYEDDTILDTESEDVLDQDEVESLDEIENDEEYVDKDGYGGSVEGIYNWDEWN
jgi:hypothetical protein